MKIVLAMLVALWGASAQAACFTSGELLTAAKLNEVCRTREWRDGEVLTRDRLLRLCRVRYDGPAIVTAPALNAAFAKAGYRCGEPVAFYFPRRP